MPEATRVLLVEDNPVYAAFLRQVLDQARAGAFEVARAATMAEALRALAADAFDVALVDPGLPDAEGLDVIRQIREAAPAMAVVVLTATDDEALALESIRGGSQDYLVKGQAESYLVPRALRHAVERQRTRQALRRLNEELEARVAARTAELVALNQELQREIEERKRSEAERLALEAKVQQAQKLESLGVLAGGIAHDFNNLLVGILGNAGIALMRLPQDSPARSSVQQVETAALRAADLTRQMLAYSGRGRFVVQAVDLTRLVSDMAHLLEVSISKKASLRYRFSPDLSPVEADAAQLQQVVMNLILNASDALGDGPGSITLGTGEMQADADYLRDSFLAEELPPGRYVYLEVGDTGCGMDEETLAKIFDPFFTTKFTGRGLGLAAVLGIVRGHQGAIKIDTAPGRGTSFRVLFPVR